MSLDSDVAVIGTGLAAIVAANALLSQGKSVIILNPDWDFFREGGVLPLNPFFPIEERSIARIQASQRERATAVLRPQFPGAVEEWTSDQKGGNGKSGFHDASAPHVRGRSRLWLRSQRSLTDPVWMKNWVEIEELYLSASEQGLHPSVMEGLVAANRFPGFSGNSEEHVSDLKGILIPDLYDVDVDRYRDGLLEYVLEKCGQDRVVTGAHPIELMPGGVRFYSGRKHRTARVGQMLVFWTPLLTPWIRKYGVKMAPVGTRVWEEWRLISRDPLPPQVIGVFEGMSVWAGVEGAPTDKEDERSQELVVLRMGALIDSNHPHSRRLSDTWAGSESFEALSKLCHEFLDWDKFSVHSMRPISVFEWNSPQAPADPLGLGSAQASPSIPVEVLKLEGLQVRVVGACDGPVVDVVEAAQKGVEMVN